MESAYASKEVSIRAMAQSVGKFKGANTVPQQVSMSTSSRKIALSELKELKAAAEQAKLELSYTKIYAPQSGMITNKTVEPVLMFKQVKHY